MNTIDALSRRTESTLRMYSPEPRSRLASTFGTIIQRLAGLAGANSPSPQLGEGYQDLIDRQILMQEQLQLVSLESNIEKSKHEARMAPIRNVRTG